MIKRLFLFLGFICFLLPLGSQTRIISDEDLIENQVYNWSKDTLYFLDGLVVLEEGGILNIEAGTIIKGLLVPTGNEHTSTLTIARGAQINANGSSDKPIIFTAESDDLTNPSDLTAEDKGLWGGLIVLGGASIGNDGLFEATVEGIEPPEPRFFFGGANNEDDSGILRYVSIRHAGMELHQGEEDYLDGLSLAGVGRSTTIEFIEIFACAHDGISFIGGTAEARYLASSFNGSDAFNYELSWQGKGQFWFGLNGENKGDHGAEFENYLPNLTIPLVDPTISNMTLIGASCATDAGASNESGMKFQKGAGGIFTNNIILDFKYALEVEDLPTGIDSRQRLENGELVISNNLWFNFCEGQEWNTGPDGIIQSTENAEDPTAQFLIEALQNNSNGILDPGLSCICRTPNNCLNPLLSPGSIALANGSPLNDIFFEPVTYVGAFNSTNNWLESWTALASYNYLSNCQRIEGNVTLDENQNCIREEGEQIGLANWILAFIGAEETYFASTNADGHFIGTPNAGEYVLRLQLPNELWEVCENDIVVTIPADGGILPTVNFLVRPISFCPYPTVDVSTPFLRRCFENTYTINYCNQGTALANDVQLEIVLDSFFNFIQSSITPSLAEEQLLVFDIGELAPGECGEIKLDVELSCDAILGQTHCLEAHILPDTLCGSSEPTPQIRIEGSCTGDSLLFELRNIGTQDMQMPAKFIVAEDDVIFLEENFQLPIAESRFLRIEANGSTFRMQAPEFPGNPKTKFTSKTIEGCGTNEVGGISTGYVSQFAEPDHAPFLSIDCQSNIGSFDPNDKQGFPGGVLAEHFIDRSNTIEFLLRFQNTGTDTAFNVTLVDTIDSNFDLQTFQPGASSHRYDWQLQAQTLVFNFNQILLADSTTNEPASHGFVKFKINPKEDVPSETQLLNEADIYFDFNAPIRTNSTWHTVRDNFLDLIQDTESIAGIDFNLQVYPNPTNRTATFNLSSSETIFAPMIRIYDSIGQIVRAARFSNQTYVFEKKELPAGIYFFQIQTQNHMVLSGRLVLH